MTDSDKNNIKPLTDKSDIEVPRTSTYSLWKVRVEAECGKKNCEEALQEPSNRPETDDFAKKKRLASSIIIYALSDAPLRIVLTVKDNPAKMFEKLDARYASKTAASKITKMTELITLKYTSLKADISAHIDHMAAMIEQLMGMNVTIEDSFSVAILVASIEVTALRSATTAIKTLAEDDSSGRLFPHASQKRPKDLRTAKVLAVRLTSLQ